MLKECPTCFGTGEVSFKDDIIKIFQKEGYDVISIDAQDIDFCIDVKSDEYRDFSTVIPKLEEIGLIIIGFNYSKSKQAYRIWISEK